MHINRWPFTVYDVVGYLAPGTFAAWHAMPYFLKHFDGNTVNYGIFDANNPFMSDWIFHALMVVMVLVVAYAFGHTISLISIVAIEKVSALFFGYPIYYMVYGNCGDTLFRFMADRVKRSFCSAWKHGGWVEKPVIFIVWAGVGFFCTPVIVASLVVIFSGYCSHVFKPLPKDIADLIRDGMDRRRRENSLPQSPESKDTESKRDSVSEEEIREEEIAEWYRIIRFFTMNNCDSAVSRMYVYVTISGFLRSFCLIVLIGIWLKALGLYELYDTAVSNIDSYVIWEFVSFCFFFVILFVGYHKFHRRYTEEIVMAFDGEACGMYLRKTDLMPKIRASNKMCKAQKLGNVCSSR